MFESHSRKILPAGFLSRQQKQDFQDCFALLDTDKTGRLSVDNLLSAFQLLNIEVQTAALRIIVSDVLRAYFVSSLRMSLCIVPLVVAICFICKWQKLP